MTFELSVKPVPTTFLTLPNGVDIELDRFLRELNNIDGHEWTEFWKKSETDMGIYQLIMEQLLPMCTVQEWGDDIRVYWEEIDELSADIDKMKQKLYEADEELNPDPEAQTMK